MIHTSELHNFPPEALRKIIEMAPLDTDGFIVVIVDIIVTCTKKKTTITQYLSH